MRRISRILMVIILFGLLACNSLNKIIMPEYAQQNETITPTIESFFKPNSTATPTITPFFRPNNTPTPTSQIFPEDSYRAVSERVEDLLARMTIDEKIGQMTQVEKNSILPGDITAYYIGSILSGGGGYPSANNKSSWAAMVANFQREALATRLGIPILYGVDAVHGHSTVYGATVFPHAVGLGATGNADLVRQIGQATAEEMLATGIVWNFAPMVAVPQDIRWGRAGESYSEDTDLVAGLSTAYILGFQTLPDGYSPASGQILFALATPKHYLGDGGTAFGTSIQNILGYQYLLDQGDMRLDEATVRRLFLPPYKAAVDNGAMSVMVSFSSWNGTKLHADKYMITTVLKGELGFRGIVVSDWGGIDQVHDNYYTAIVTSINAGVDMNMVPYDYKQFIALMKSAVSKGDISQSRIDDAVRRILMVKFGLGLYDHPFADTNLISTVGSDTHRQLARQAVRESLVLLKNEKDALPIAKDTSLIYVAGMGANDIGMQCGGWTIEWQGLSGNIQYGTSILQGIKQAVSAKTKVEYSISGQFAGMADVGIAVVGEKPYAEGLGDVFSLNLSQSDISIITNLRASARKLIVVILSGRPLVITNQFRTADSWVAAWLPGTEGNGISDVLFGDFPFTGKLPYTWPRSNRQLPININTVGNKTGCDAPFFPLGYGMGDAGGDPIQWMDCP